MKYILLFLAYSQILWGAVAPHNNHVEVLLRDAVQKELPDVSRVSLQNVNATADIPKGAELVATQPSPPIGYVQFQAEWVEKGQIRHASGNATVKVFGKIAVAKNPIRHGEGFSEDNVKFEERELSTLKVTGYYTDRRSLDSVRAKGYLAPNAVIGFSQTETPLLVSSGQIVDLKNEKRNLRVSVRVKALESGRLNQWIKVENISSRKILYGRVTDSGTLSLH